MRAAAHSGCRRALMFPGAYFHPQVCLFEGWSRLLKRCAIPTATSGCQLRSRGWVMCCALSLKMCPYKYRVADAGIMRVIYTDVAQDGRLRKSNVEATAQIVRESGARGPDVRRSDIARRHTPISGTLNRTGWTPVSTKMPSTRGALRSRMPSPSRRSKQGSKFF